MLIWEIIHLSFIPLLSPKALEILQEIKAMRSIFLRITYLIHKKEGEGDLLS